MDKVNTYALMSLAVPAAGPREVNSVMSTSRLNSPSPSSSFTLAASINQNAHRARDMSKLESVNASSWGDEESRREKILSTRMVGIFG